MITFSSKVTGDIQMLAAHGTQLLRLIGKTDFERGVITSEEIPNAIARLSSAGRHDQESRKAGDADAERNSESGERPAIRINLAQRSFPLLEMLKRAQSAGEPVLWGV